MSFDSEKRLVILFSGSGTNMINLIENLHEKTFLDSQNRACKIRVAKCICNVANATGIDKLKPYKIPCEIIEHKGKSREQFDSELVAKISESKPHLTILSGFMRILTPIFTQNVKAINIHPSFLPLHKGAHAIKDSFESGENFGGVSVHWVSQELDSGEIILQEKLPKITGENLADFEARIHALEYEIFPKATRMALGNYKIQNLGV